MENRMTVKRCLSLLLPFGLCVLLAACATPATERKASSHQVDEAYMSSLNASAVRSGVRVIWVNPPQKRAQEQNDQ